MNIMSGGFHLFFGDLLGLLLWYFSTGKDGKKRWSFGLLFLFIISNHFGPDIATVWQFLADLAQSEVFYLAASAIHSYLGYILFAPVWAALWYVIFAWIGRKQVKKTIARGEVATNPVHVHSYADVFLVILIGGISHHFIDLLGHAREVDGTPYIRGRFGLMFVEEGIVAAVFGLIAAIIVVSVVLHYIRVAKPTRQQFGQKLRAILGSKQFLKVVIFLGIAILNSLLLYLVMLPQGPLQTTTKEYPWNSNSYTIIYFNFAFALIATEDYASGTAVWYLVTCIVVFIILFFTLYFKMKRVTLLGHTFRAELLVFVGLLVALLVGYLLQPIIGNISNAEADLGTLTFIWSTLGTILVGSAFVNAKIYEENRQPDLQL